MRTLRSSLSRLFSSTSEQVPIAGGKEQILTRVLIVGLGNYPAPRSRHSVGQYLLQHIATQNNTQLTHKRACKGHMGTFTYNDCQIYLLKPKLFMNECGKSVLKAVKELDIEPKYVLVLHDELDLPLGKFKIKQGGSPNGHNGVIDTSERLKTLDFMRLRIGIGRPDNKDEVCDYVLSDFTKTEKSLLSVMQSSLIETVYKATSIMLNPPEGKKGTVKKAKKAKTEHKTQDDT